MRFKMPTLSVLLLVLLSIITNACGDTGGAKKNTDAAIVPIIESEEQPASYFLEDATCQESREPISLTKTVIDAWQGEDVAPLSASLAHVRTETSLTSAIVENTTYGDQYVRYCDYSKPDGQKCTGDSGRELNWHRVSTNGFLRVCQDNHRYERDSYERVALSSVHFIEKSYQAYVRLGGAKAKNLPRLSVSVLPHFVDYYNNFFQNGRQSRLKYYTTHNMAYYPTEQMIAVFPEAASMKSEVPGYFWESSFVLAHEFAHHIDNSRNAAFNAALGLTWNPITHAYDELGLSAALVSDKAARPQIRGVVSEAFADLIAYYTDGGNPAALVGLPCFGHNRNVGNGIFRNGDEKILSVERLESLLGQSEASPYREACAPNYADMHTGGAILAHALDKVFALLVSKASDIKPEAPADFEQRYRFTLEWMDKFAAHGKDLPLNATADELLRPIASSLKAVSENWLKGLALAGTDQIKLDSLRTSVCTAVADSLPALPARPYTQDGSTSCL